MHTSTKHRSRGSWFIVGTLLVGTLGCPTGQKGGADEAGPPGPGPTAIDPSACSATVVATVGSLIQPVHNNRLGAQAPQNVMFALVQDLVIPTSDPNKPFQSLVETPEWQAYDTCLEGSNDCLAELERISIAYQDEVSLRPDLRPRPLTLRVNQGECLAVNFANFLPAATTNDSNLTTNWVGFHPMGMPLVDEITNDGQFAGSNQDSLAAPGTARLYRFFAQEEGSRFVTSPADQDNSQALNGLFASVNVQPQGGEYYRSQVTQEDLALASQEVPSNPLAPRPINYAASFASADPARPWRWVGKPILAMTQPLPGNRRELVYGDLTAIITGPNTGAFTSDSPSFTPNPAAPDRRQPYREFAITYHPSQGTQQAFGGGSGTNGNVPIPASTLGPGNDTFAMNYGIGGIGAEILSNRIGVGPMYDCVDCKYEEFFLSSWSVGDPAMVVDQAANWIDCTPSTDPAKPQNCTAPDPTSPPNFDVVPTGRKASIAYFPDDPSNVYHSYLGDHVKLRIHNADDTHHLHHLHAHQWLHSPNSDEGHYLDSQLIGSNSSFDLEITYNGSGNRNQTIGDSIFHCHFYPHFAQGMWSMWRVHDVFEAGTALDAAGRPVAGARALPDGEIFTGTPIPALVPVPTLPMAPAPSPVFIADGQVNFGTPGAGDRWGKDVTVNPGFPFFIPGMAGKRAPHPPKDFAVLGEESLDGGLPRHLVVGSIADSSITHYENAFDFSKFVHETDAMQLPEDGTPVERVAMASHAVRWVDSITPEGQPGKFTQNGMPAVAGAPYADPCYTVDPACLAEHDGQYDECPPIPVTQHRKYRGADIQHDVVLNKDGWHYPQQRLAVLWDDISPTLDNERPPQPFFFRANSGECIEFWLANLVPYYYELDNFEIRTPTDILGQHIHLVKFDVTSSDGATNGWNYEDGTLSFGEVEERISAFNDSCVEGTENCGLMAFGDPNQRTKLTAEPPTWICPAGDKSCLARANEEWVGAQATVQRWWADPLLNDAGKDRTIRTVFTHDHFGPSTHQQAGLYAGLLVEPTGSQWLDAETGAPLGSRDDGGPTSWQAVIKTTTESESYREFALEFQDFAFAYAPGDFGKTAYPSANENRPQSEVPAWNASLNTLAKTSPISPATGKTVRGMLGGFIYTGSSPAPVVGAPLPQLVSAPAGGNFGTFTVNYRQEPLAMRLGSADLGGPAVCDGTSVPTEACDASFSFASLTRANPDLNSQHVGQGSFPPALTSGVYGTDPFTPMLRAYEGERVQIRTLVGAHLSMHDFSLHGFAWLFEPSNHSSGYRGNQGMGISEHFEMEFQMPPTTGTTPPASAGDPTVAAGCEATEAGQFSDYLYATSSSTQGLGHGNWGLIRSYSHNPEQCLFPVPGTPAEVDWSCPGPERKYKVTAQSVKLTYNDRTDETTTLPQPLTNSNAMVYTACDATADPACEPPAAATEMQPLVLRARAGECVVVELTNSVTPPNPPVGAAIVTAPSSATGSVTLAKVTAQLSTSVSLHPQMVGFDANSSGGLNLGFNPTQSVTPGNTITYRWYAGIIENQAGAVVGKPIEFGAINLLSADPLLQSAASLVGALIIEPADATWELQGGQSTFAKVTHEGGKRSFYEPVILTIDNPAIDNATGVKSNQMPMLINYGSDPNASRFSTTSFNSACQYSDNLQGGTNGSTPMEDPQTQVFEVPPAADLRVRVLHPWGGDDEVFELFGHIWPEEPYGPDSSVITVANPDSIHMGFRDGWGATAVLNVITQAGGPEGVVGDYLYRLRRVKFAARGIWGVIRVADPTKPAASTPFFCTPPYGNTPTVAALAPDIDTPGEAHHEEMTEEQHVHPNFVDFVAENHKPKGDQPKIKKPK